MKLHLCLSVAFFVVCTARAQLVQPLDLQIRTENLPKGEISRPVVEKASNLDACQDLHIMIFTNSSHPGGNKENRLNENNGGLEADCFSQGIRYRTGATRNSKFGDTIILGAGHEIDIASLGPFTLRGGGFFNLIYYEVKSRLQVGVSYEQNKDGLLIKKKRYVMIHSGETILALPTISVGVGYKVSKKWEIYLEQNFLPEGIRLRSFGVRKMF